MYVVPNTSGPGTTITLRIRSPVWGADLTQSTAVSSAVLRRDGSATNFAWTIQSATPQELVCSYAFVGGEFTGTGGYLLAPSVTIPAGPIPCQTVAMFVTSPFMTNAPQLDQTTYLAMTSQISPMSSQISPAWQLQTATGLLSPFRPWNKVNANAGAMVLTLWTPSAADILVASDYKNQTTGVKTVTFTAPAGWSVPTGGGAYSAPGGSVVFNAAGWGFRWKADQAEGLWIPW